jgi:eukaryotic-like serine/threonine-protein kinase
MGTGTFAPGSAVAGGAVASPIHSQNITRRFWVDDTLGGVRERVIGARFRIDRELGGGGMSQVFLATDLSLDRQVVIKVLSADQSAGVNGARFRREIQLVARLQHPHVVPILSAGEAEGALYYIMPFLPGESLRARLAREGPVRVADAIGIVREILDALSFAHANGVIHRDIKPEHALIGGGHAVVADFGVARALREAGALTSSNMALGTPAYYGARAGGVARAVLSTTGHGRP